MVPPPSQNAVGICNQITLLILYYISARLVTLFKVNDAPLQVPNIFFILLLVSSSSVHYNSSTILNANKCTHLSYNNITKH